MARTYSREEVQAILGRALEQQHADGEGLSHEELLAVGRELGVPTSAVESAAANVGQELALSNAVDERIRRMRRAFVSHLMSFVLVIALLAAVNIMVGGPLWFFWAAMGWGIGLAFHARSVVAPDRERLAKQAKRHLERERDREARRERRERIRHGVRRVERAVEEGVENALRAVADVLETPSTGGKATNVPRTRVGPEGRESVRVADDAERDARAEMEAESAEEHGRDRRRG